MAGKVGAVHSVEQVTILVPSKNVMRDGKNRRYVFTGTFAAGLRRTEENGGLALYMRFKKAIRLGFYNTVELYGMEAIDIDKPQNTKVSVQLVFKIVEKEEQCGNF